MKEEDEKFVKIKPLTPIWTGDAERNGTTLRETGIIGSLRWWYEALIIGLGGTACDPTSDSRCPDKRGNHCDACELFGCTGWARKFRLEIEFNNIIPEIWIGTREKRNNKYLKRSVSGLMSDGAIILNFIPLRELTQNEWVLLNKTLLIITNYGALGAKTSQGNGVIKIIENNLPYNDKNPEKSEFKRSGNSVNSPNLNSFFFYKFHITFNENISDLIDKKVFWTHASDHESFRDNWENWKKLWNDYHFLPIAFHIRDFLRPLENDGNKRHNYFGELGKGSKVFVSHGYKIDDTKVEIRVWGYEEVGEINKIKNSIKERLDINKNNLNLNKLNEKLFSNGKESLESCTLTEEKEGSKLLEEL